MSDARAADELAWDVDKAARALRKAIDNAKTGRRGYGVEPQPIVNSALRGSGYYLEKRDDD